MHAIVTLIMPKAPIIQQIGLWNTILATSYYLYAAMFLTTPIERQIMNELRKKYIPCYKRWNKFQWMINKACQVGEHLGTSLENWLDNKQKSFQNQRKYNLQASIAK